jgi:PhnB protein
MDKKKIPERYRYAVIPHIMVEGAEEAINFYGKAFRAQELFRVQAPGGPIIHAELSIEGSVVMVGEAAGFFKDPFSLQGTSVGIHVYVENVDECFSQALAAGAIALQPIADMFYGDRVGILRDPFGHIWVLLTSFSAMSPEEIRSRGEQFFSEHWNDLNKNSGN